MSCAYINRSWGIIFLSKKFVLEKFLSNFASDTLAYWPLGAVDRRAGGAMERGRGLMKEA